MTDYKTHRVKTVLQSFGFVVVRQQKHTVMKRYSDNATAILPRSLTVNFPLLRGMLKKLHIDLSTFEDKL